MITLIHITEHQIGKILDYIPLGDFWDDNHHKSLKDTLEFFEFRTFGDKRYSQHLEKMNRIIIPDEDGTFREFVVFHAIKYRLQSAVVVDVYAPASYLLLKKAKVIKPQRVSEYTASQHLGFALNGTEWRPGIVESGRIRTLDIENHTNPYAYIRRIANEFELEPRFRVETDGNKVIGRYVDLLERVGEWQGREVEFGRDLLGIERKVDDSNVVTALIGLGPERDDGTRLEVFVEDEEALQRWGIPNQQTGELMHLIETYEPESTDQDMTIARLTELTRNELEKRINSVVEYTADVADLEKVPGMENKKIRFGDTIKIKDTGFNPPLYLEARVHTQDRSLSQPEKKKVTLGDYIEYTEEEVHAIWKQLQAEIAKKVSMAQVTEVVYTKPEVDERDDAVREHADTVAENAKIEAIQVAAEDASKKAKQAEDSAKEYTDGRLQNTVAKDIFENTVTDLLNNIAQKVDSTRFEQVESELRGIAEGLQHEVAEHADTLEAHGGKITKLETDVDEVEGKINATISELEALGDTVSRHETQIDANAQAIALKADKQELDLLSGTVSDISSELSVMAGKIEAKAERSEVEKLESDVSKVSQDVSKLSIDVDGIKTNVGSISQTVSNHSTQISNINSTLTQHADMIALKVEKSEFDSVTNSLGNRISTIEQTADSISLEVRDIKANVYTKSEVDSAIDGIQVGGRNLLLNTSGERTSTFSGWQQYFKDIRVGEYGLAEFRKGGKFTIKGYIKNIEGNERVGLMVHCETSSTSSGYRQFNKVDRFIAPKSEGYFEFTFNAPKDDNITSVYIATRHDSGSAGQSTVKFSEVKLEKGNKATDWTPAPEDVQDQIDDIEGTLASHSTKIEQNAQQIQLRATKAEVDTLSGRVNQAESQITQLAGQIELRATKTEVDALSGRVSTVESEIKAQADEIAIKVDKDGIINAINVSTEGIKIKGDKINLVGAVNVLSDISGNLGTINSGVINSVTINGSTINSRKDSRNYTTISQNHIHSEGEWNDTEFGFGQMYGIFDVNNGNISMEVGQVRNGVRNTAKAVNVDFTMMGMAIRSENNGFYINNIGAISWGDWFDGPDSKGSIYPTYGEDAYYNITPGFVLDANFVDIRQIIANGNARQIAIRESDTLKQWHIEVNNENFYISETNVAVRLTLDTNGTLYTSSDIIFGNNTGRLVNDGGYGYLQTVNSEYRVTKFKSTTYIPIRAASFPSGSLEEYKTNIEKWEGSALEIIRSADIYKYQLKSDIADGRYIERYGLVIGEGYRTPKEFIDGDGIEQYAMNSINMKAIQELDKEQQDLKGRIARLEAENELLREKIKKLEGMIA